MIFTSRFPVLLTLAVAIAGVFAQLDTCGQTCVNTTIPAFCTSSTNVTCLCTNKAFQNALVSCLTNNCSSADLAIAAQLDNATCANVTTSSSSATPSGTGNSATPSSSSSGSPSTKSNGATAVEQLPLLTAVIAIAGTLMGGAFAL